MKKKLIAALLLTAVITGGLAALAAGGSSADPLISLRFLSENFLSQTLSEADARANKAAKADYDAAVDRLDSAYGKYAGQAGGLGGDWEYTDLFERREYRAGDVVRLAPGSGFIFLEGSAFATAVGGKVVDVTNASDASSVNALTPGHRYLAGEGATVSVTILSDAAYLAPQGYAAALPGSESTTPFTDLVRADWYYSYVQYVYNTGLFKGVSDTLFSPTASMTRAMLATVLYRHAGTPPASGGTAAFTDVAAGSWYEGAVGWAAGNDIVNGMGGGLYAPDANVTREQMAAMLHRYAAHKGGDTAALGNLGSFPDGGKTSNWAAEAVSWTVGAGIIGGRADGTLDPCGTATRAEVAAMLQRFSALFP